VKVLFGEGIPEVFQELPRPVQVKAARIIDLIAAFPGMYPIRWIGLMRGYLYFNVLGYHFITPPLRKKFASRPFFLAAWNRRKA
jgi:hypothetical protein